MQDPNLSDNKHIEMWKIKRMIKNLDNCKTNGSMVSLVIPPKDQVTSVSKLLNDEAGTAQNIKSTKTRQSILEAITSTREKLKLYKNTPPNGLVVYCGRVIQDDGKTEKKFTLDFEPFKPINRFLYKCDTHFHTDPLQVLLEDDDKFGFIVVDGSGALYGTLQGNNREILQKI